MHSLGASETPMIFPGVLDARSSLHHTQDNLGNNKPGVACRVDKHSRGSLQKTNFHAQKQAVSFLVQDRIAPASKGKSLTRSLSEPTPLRHFAFEESTRQQLQQQVPPPTQLWHVVFQLRAEIEALQKVVRQLAGLSFSKEIPHTLGAELEEDGAHNQTNNNTNNNNNDNNNDNDHNTNIQESGFSLDLDDDNPESSVSGSEPDLDKSSLDSFDPKGDEDSSLDLGLQTMTIESSLGNLDQQEKDDQEGMIVGTAWDPSLDQPRGNFGRTKPMKRVTFSKATLAAYNDKEQNNRKQQNKGSHPTTSSQLEQLEHKEKSNKAENEWCKTTRDCWKKAPARAPTQATSLEDAATACNSFEEGVRA